MSNVQLFTQNLLFDDLTVSTLVSSEKSGFLASNLNDYQRRQKVWRSDGHWEITASNHQLVIENAPATPIVVSVPVGTYSSTAAFLSAIKTALNANGSYDVTLDASTGRVKIARLSGAYFSLLTTHVSSTLAGVLGFSTLVNRTGSMSYIADSLKISTGESIRWDLGTARNPQAFLALGERNAELKLSPTAIITLEAHITDDWSAPLFSQVIDYNRYILSLTDVEGLAGTDAYRYWRLHIQDTGNINGHLELGCVYLGDLWSPERGAVKFPYAEKVKDLSNVAYSESGHATVYRRAKTTTLEVDWGFLTHQDCEDLTSIWELVGLTDPFFINLDPGEVFSVSRNRHFKMVRFDSEPRFTLSSPGVWEFEMSLREEL